MAKAGLEKVLNQLPPFPESSQLAVVTFGDPISGDLLAFSRARIFFVALMPHFSLRASSNSHPPRSNFKNPASISAISVLCPAPFDQGSFPGISELNGVFGFSLKSRKSHRGQFRNISEAAFDMSRFPLPFSSNFPVRSKGSARISNGGGS